MRKKLLRSRSGFEKPESREEAIMQNILGASNVLEPSESNIEEILKSILYNTPYTKEAEFEIEKILLAIKNNGTYDSEGESRDTKILIAILNDLDYTEEAESRIEELFIEWLHQRSNVNVLEGVPPLTFVAKGNPLINYEISGNTVQSGTPTPDNPVIPQGTGDKTANLLDVTLFNNGYHINSQGNIETFTGRIATTTPIDVSNYTSVTFSYTTTRDNDNFIYATFSGNTLVERVAGKTSGFSIDTTNCNKLYLCLYNLSSQVSTADIITAMLNSGSTALPYEPFGIKIPISSANTTTNNYLGEVESTRRIKKLVLTGEETLTSGSVIGQIRTPLTGAINSLGLCTHYIIKTSYGGAFPYFRIANNVLWFELSPDGYETKEEALTDFKAYLAAQYAAGTPVTVWYVLATEETAVVNEPLMRIGDYTDTLSMEQAGVPIPTANGSTTLDVDTTVKPSNIYIEYK